MKKQLYSVKIANNECDGYSAYGEIFLLGRKNAREMTNWFKCVFAKVSSPKKVVPSVVFSWSKHMVRGV